MPLSLHRRLVILTLFVFALFAALIVKFFKIQILEHERWSKIARNQHQRMVTEPFKRGLFYSNTTIKQGHPETPQPLVVDVPKFHLYVDPSLIEDKLRDEVALRLAKIIDLDSQKTLKLRAQFDYHTRSRKLAVWLDKETRGKIEDYFSQFAKSHKIPRNALYFVEDYQRSYPFGKLLGPVLHALRDEKAEKDNQGIPTGGLELVFDRLLQGSEGKRWMERSPRHSLETDRILKAPQDGADVYLTINHHLQAIAEEEIAKAVKAANAKAGWAILMEPRTGEIWALAQTPGFSPAEYRTYFNDPALRDLTKVKALTDPYEPGSTIKPLTIALALKANAVLKQQGKPPLFSPFEKIPTSNGVFPGRSKPISDTHKHNYLNMYMAIQKSSNIYMSRLVQRMNERLGEKWYRNALEEVFGFGLKTGIELPGESAGLLPTPGKLNPNGTLEWSVPTPFSIAFGHNILTNSMQMVRSYAVIANGGYEVQPTLVKKVVRNKREGESETLLDNTSPERIKGFRRVLEPGIVEELLVAMKYATKTGGSAPKADIFGYTEVGKTGTSEKIVGGKYSKKVHISTFIGFAPVINPRFVLFIAIDEPEYKFVPGVGKNQMGGNCAAPAFREIGQRTLQYLGVEPDDPYGYPKGDPRYDPERADWAKEVKALKEIYTEWNH